MLYLALLRWLSIALLNREIKYLLTVIDVFSKQILDYSFKTENWTGSCKRISRISKRRAGKMWIEKGREFYNKDAHKLFELYFTEKKEKYCLMRGLIVE